MNEEESNLLGVIADMIRGTSPDMAVILVRGVPQRVLAEKDLAREKTGILQCLASSMSMKSPSAPESISATTMWVSPLIEAPPSLCPTLSRYRPGTL